MSTAMTSNATTESRRYDEKARRTIRSTGNARLQTSHIRPPSASTAF